MFKGDSPCLEEIEHMIDHYIGLKTCCHLSPAAS